MTILSIMRDTANNASNITIVRMITTDTVEEVILPNWLSSQAESIAAANGGAPFEFLTTDVVLLFYGDQNNVPWAPAFFYVTQDLSSIVPISYMYPYNVGLTAHAGGGQTNATILNIGTNLVATVASNTDSVKLPNDVLGQTCIVLNNTTNTLSIFPHENDQIDTLGVNTRLNVGANGRRMFIGVTTNRWFSFD